MTSFTRVIRQLGLPDEERHDLDVLGPFAVVTANTPNAGMEANTQAHEELGEAIQTAGLHGYPLHGIWSVPDGDHQSPVDEDAFFVTSSSEDFAAFEEAIRGLLERFQQPAALMSDGKTIWVLRDGERQEIGDTFSQEAMEQAYHQMRGQPKESKFTFAETRMLRISHKETSELATSLKEVAYSLMDDHPDAAEDVLTVARQIVANTITGNFPTPSVLRDAVLLLREAGVRFAIIGGTAVAVHGTARSTDDIDMVVDKLPDASLLRDRDAMRKFNFYPGKSRTGTVLTLDHRTGQLELLVANTPLERWALEQASDQDILGSHVPVVQPTALVGLKVRAAQNPKRRAKDLSDALSVLLANKVNTETLKQYLSEDEQATLDRLVE